MPPCALQIINSHRSCAWSSQRVLLQPLCCLLCVARAAAAAPDAACVCRPDPLSLFAAPSFAIIQCAHLVSRARMHVMRLFYTSNIHPDAGWSGTERVSYGIRHPQVQRLTLVIHSYLPPCCSLHHHHIHERRHNSFSLTTLSSPPPPPPPRLEPQLMIIGQSAGVAVAQALRNGRQVSQLHGAHQLY